jgi:membrane protein DedA with SNARE-associated domain
MAEIVMFLGSVIASIVAYYICKWLDRILEKKK